MTVSLDSHFDTLVFAYGFKIDTFRSINITWGKVSGSGEVRETLCRLDGVGAQDLACSSLPQMNWMGSKKG